MTDKTPQKLQKKPGEPGGEKARELVRDLWHNDSHGVQSETVCVDPQACRRCKTEKRVAGALAACALESARPFKEALMVNPFSDGQDGDLCLWCRTSYPRGLTKFEEHFLPEHHLATCELMLVMEKWAVLERAAEGESLGKPEGRG